MRACRQPYRGWAHHRHACLRTRLASCCALTCAAARRPPAPRSLCAAGRHDRHHRQPQPGGDVHHDLCPRQQRLHRRGQGHEVSARPPGSGAQGRCTADAAGQQGWAAWPCRARPLALSASMPPPCSIVFASSTITCVAGIAGAAVGAPGMISAWPRRGHRTCLVAAAVAGFRGSCHATSGLTLPLPCHPCRSARRQ